MNASDFWRGLANDFRSVPIIREFSAYRHYYTGSTQLNWQLTTDQIALAEFNALAARGASMLIPKPTGDLATAWLEALWHKATHGFVRSTSEVMNQPQFPAGKMRLPIQLRGKLDRVFEASSTLCRQFESSALQTEFEEKQRNDPQNWPPLLQEYRAFKEIKKLMIGPHEQIPESLVRDSIARQLGIKPEDVTPKQINFELAGLLRYYPAITLIPSSEALEQDSEPKGGEAQETPNDTRKKRRLTPSIDCPKAARRLEKHLSDKGIGLNKFAVAVGTNEKTLYRFRKSGKVHRDIFEAIAREMGITKEDLLNS